MKNTFFYLSALLLLVACKQTNMEKTPYAWPSNISAPKAAEKLRTFVQHSDTITDEYYWLNDFFKKGPDSTAVVEYLQAENRKIYFRKCGDAYRKKMNQSRW